MYIYGDIHISALGHSSDEALISRIVADDDEGNKLGLLYHNPNLTEAHFMALATDASVEVRETLAGHKSLSAKVLEKLRSDSEESVRVKALCHSQSESKYFVEAVLNGKLSPLARTAFCSNVKAVGNFDAFKALWNTSKKSYQVLLMWSLHSAALRDSLTDASRVMYDVTPSPSPIDPKVLEMIHKLIRSGEASNAVKTIYARLSVALPELLDMLKNDPYKHVIESIALNSSAWASTHEYLYANHKRSKVLSGLAWSSRDNELLNTIYHETKSKEALYLVKKNPAFTLL